MARERIAIVGSGISGLTCAYLLSPHHEVTLFEAQDTLGGHTNTESISLGDTIYPVNTGFIVFNNRTYPNFIKLMAQLGVEAEDSTMSFSVHDQKTGLEYNGTSLNALFCQRKNLLNRHFWNMLQDILRFNRQALKDLDSGRIEPSLTLGAYLTQHGYRTYFTDYYIVPMAAAIWSCPEIAVYDFPLDFFLKFFANHGLLNITGRPTWKVIKGGSESYIRAMMKNFEGKYRLQTQVTSVERFEDHVTLYSPGQQEDFDHVIFACHSDQAFECLAQPTGDERQVLGALKYQKNDVVLHTDTRLLPKIPGAWAAWNYFIPAEKNPNEDQPRTSVTYNMNILQNFHHAEETFCVTLNRRQDIDPKKIIKIFDYAHPVYTLSAGEAQRQFDLISARNRTHYCGAYWLNDFHEDGVNSALRVLKHWGLSW